MSGINIGKAFLQLELKGVQEFEKDLKKQEQNVKDLFAAMKSGSAEQMFRRSLNVDTSRSAAAAQFARMATQPGLMRQRVETDLQNQETSAFFNRAMAGARTNPDLLRRQVGVDLRNEQTNRIFAASLQRERNVQQHGAIGGAVANAHQGISQAFGALQANPYVAAATAVMSVVEESFNKMKALAGAANPIALERFDYATRDLNAVVGQMMVPILEKSTEVVRLFADTLNAVLPTQNDMRQVMAELDPVFQDLRQSAADLAPLFRVAVVAALQEGAVAMKAFALGVKLLTGQVEMFLDLARKLPFGEKVFGKKGERSLPSSFGIGDFRTPTISNDIAAAKNAFMIEALRVSAGMATKDEPTLTEQQEQTRLLRKIADQNSGPQDWSPPQDNGGARFKR